MLINLKTYSVKEGPQQVKIELDQRLPARVGSPCVVNCKFDVKAFDNYYLLTLRAEAMITINCQRCFDEFSHHYVNQTELAVCNTDEMAEKMLEQYESIVSEHNQVDLVDLVTDELHLYAPEFHSSTKECDNEASKFITKEQE
ncbi:MULTISPECIES: YceD family protein [Legionella]|uniref:Large ribosomal RNA subunit accumulation protein YceD n=1 Tax=Legionella drozanskii LLAP-1 TaxID=1212489 RepID=A0A0W0TBE1_9GAMM|nr:MULTISPECIES: YceD family protein [Legionella]KTC92919.1 metal-binding protein [Legionella drozanskii LLAP-1]PJE13138.1 MAG: metal-binding protein [Legionella sp.]